MSNYSLFKNSNRQKKPSRITSYLENLTIYDVLFILLTISYFSFALHLWMKTNGIPGFLYTNVDEIYFAESAAFNFKHFGFLNSFFLLDYASGLDPAAHPFVYTHNIAFPDYIGAIIYRVGFDNIKYLSFFSIFFSCIGFFVVYYFFRRNFHPQMAITIVTMAMLDYSHVLVHSILYFRSFQWIVFFMVLLSFFEWVKHRNSILFRVLFGCSITLVTSYEQTTGYLLILTVLIFYFFNFPKNVKKIRFFPLFTTLVVFAILPIMVQALCMLIYFKDIHVVLVDQVYTYTNRLFKWPDRSDMCKLYYENGILLFGYSGHVSLLQNLKSFFKWFPQEYGIISSISGICVVIYYFCVCSKKVIDNTVKIFDQQMYLVNGVKLIALLSFGLIIFVVVLSEHVRTVYVDCGVSLFEIYGILFAGFGVSVIFSLLFRLINSRLIRTCFVIVVFYVAVQNLLVEYAKNPPIPMAASDVLPKYKGKSFETTYHAQYVSLFTRQWANSAWISSLDDENNLVNRDYIMLKDHYSEAGRKKYARAEYFLQIFRFMLPTRSQGFRKKTQLVEEGIGYEIYKLK